jgi:transposase
MVRPAASLHRNDAGRQRCGHAYYRLALHTTPQNNSPRRIEADDATTVLTQIDPQNCDIHELPPCCEVKPHYLAESARPGRGGPSIKGEHKQAIGRSRGGRNTKIHAIADAKGRLLSILLTGGQAHDCPLAQRLIRRTKAARKMLGDRAYDSAELRQWLGERGIKPVVPNKSNRKQPFSFDRKSYKQRHRIENAFCRLKDFRRIATRYDRLARNFLASVCLVAAIVWWTL